MHLKFLYYKQCKPEYPEICIPQVLNVHSYILCIANSRWYYQFHYFRQLHGPHFCPKSVVDRLYIDLESHRIVTWSNITLNSRYIICMNEPLTLTLFTLLTLMSISIFQFAFYQYNWFLKIGKIGSSNGNFVDWSNKVSVSFSQILVIC
jgi:hypothetical protein